MAVSLLVKLTHGEANSVRPRTMRRTPRIFAQSASACGTPCIVACIPGSVRLCCGPAPKRLAYHVIVGRPKRAAPHHRPRACSRSARSLALRGVRCGRRRRAGWTEYRTRGRRTAHDIWINRRPWLQITEEILSLRVSSFEIDRTVTTIQMVRTIFPAACPL